jgi:hypothetical protein
MMYHHHFGTRNQGGKATQLKAFGWKERNEKAHQNRLVMDGTTDWLFSDHDFFIGTMAYGEDFVEYKLYEAYLSARPSRFRHFKLLSMAGELFERNIRLCFYILTLIQKELLNDRKFIGLYVRVCENIGYDMEAEAYRNLYYNL